MRSVRRDDDDVARPGGQLVVADAEGDLALECDEDLLVGVPVQARPVAGRRVDEDDADAGPAVIRTDELVRDAAEREVALFDELKIHVPIRPAPTAGIIDYQPTLSGTLVELRPLRADDYDALYAAAADPAIWEQHQVKDRHREDVFRPYFEMLLESKEALVVLDRATGEIVGASRYHGYDEGESEVEIGWTFLVRSHWGGAVNRELKSLMLRHAFRFVRNVVFLVDPGNLRSQRAVEKIGGVRIAPRLNAAGLEIVVYRICRADFAG